MSPYIDPDNAPLNFHAGFKVGWAKHHLRLLEAEVKGFLDSKPYAVFAQDDLERGEYILHLHVAPPPLTMALMVGDWAACLRGSLDHLATALTKTPRGTYNERASFPIIGVKNSNTQGSSMNALKGVPGAAVDIIEALQPYHAGNAYKTTKLWRLHRLWNIDKHRNIPLDKTSLNVKFGYPAYITPISGGTDGSGIVRFPLSAKGQVNLQPTVEIGIQFGDPGEGIVIPYRELIEIHDFIRNDLMAKFQRFF